MNGYCTRIFPRPQAPPPHSRTRQTNTHVRREVSGITTWKTPILFEIINFRIFKKMYWTLRLYFTFFENYVFKILKKIHFSEIYYWLAVEKSLRIFLFNNIMNILSKTSMHNIQHQSSRPKSSEINFWLVVQFITHFNSIQNIHRYFPNILKQSF